MACLVAIAGSVGVDVVRVLVIEPWIDVPLQAETFTRVGARVRVGGQCGLAGCAQDEVCAVDGERRRFCQLILERDFDAVPYVGADGERLNGIIADAERESVVVRGARGFLRANGRKLLSQGEHVALRVVIAPSIDDDVDADSHHVVELAGSSDRTTGRLEYGRGVGRKVGAEIRAL